MNVLSLFDGISCGQIALNRAGIQYDNYYSSEIDNYAITVTQNNYPNTIQIGDVTKLNGENLPKIDLLIGGSPCQGFSFAGKQLNFNDNRSKLFFEYVRILEETKPKYFLLENVIMKQEYRDVISSYLGVKPIEINSSTVSAQYRRRLYWTNIPNVGQPIDKKIFITDILEHGKGGIKLVFDENGIYRGTANNGKSIILEFDVPPPYSIYESRTEKAKEARRLSVKLHGIDTNPRGPSYKEYRINKKDKCNCILTSRTELDNIIDWSYHYRPLTITEAERLQTVPDNYTNYASDTQRWKMLGNGWTVDVIAHILSHIK